MRQCGIPDFETINENSWLLADVVFLFRPYAHNSMVECIFSHQEWILPSEKSNPAGWKIPHLVR
jgi:hypothetical protein